MAAVKKSAWTLGYRIAGVIVFIFSLLQLSAPSWARSLAANARPKASQALKPESDTLMESFLQESRFSNQEINSLTAEPILLALGQKAATSETQPRQAMTKQDQPPQTVKLKQNGQPKQAMKLKQGDQPKQAMKLAPADKTSQPQQAMKLKQGGQPQQAMKLAPADKTSQPQQAMKLKQGDQPRQAMKLAPATKTQPQQAMKLKQGEPGAKQ